MNHLRQVLMGTAAALLSAVIVLGSFSLVLTEGMDRIAQQPPVAAAEVELTLPSLLAPTTAAAQPGTPSPSRTVTLIGEGTPTLTRTVTPTSSATATVTASLTAVCQLPEGWPLITVKAGYTLKSLADLLNVTEDALMEANCLSSIVLIEGTLLAVPEELPESSSPEPPADLTPTPYACGAPRGWVIYIVRSGDTLFSLSRDLGKSVAQLQVANCLGSSTLIRTGQSLWVPYLPSRQAPPPPTSTLEPPTPTSEPPTPTEELPTPALTAPPPTPLPTSTLLPTPSPAPTEPPPTSVPEPTSIPTTQEPAPAPEEPNVPTEP